jgi:HK97 family phage portal protein
MDWFGYAPKRKHQPQVRSLSNPATWEEVVAAFNGYGSGQTNNALKVSAVFSCNDRIAKDVASLPFRPVRRTDTGQEMARDYDQWFVSNRPNPWMTRYTYAYTLVSHVNLYGNAFSPIVRENGRPVLYDIWNPQHVKAMWEGNRLYWYHEKKKDVVSDADMIHLMWYTEDGIEGKSVLRYARESIEQALNASKMSSDMYKNQMWSPGYISYKQPLSAEQAEMISRMWGENYLGEANKSNTPVLDNGSEYKAFGMSMQDAQMIESREFSVADIARFFGVPASKIGLREGNVSYNSLEQENIAYVQDTIMPRCISIEQEFDRKAVSEEDADDIRFKHELKSRMRGDTAARTSFYQMGLNTGVFSINDVRELEDMNTIGPDGDERLIQVNMTTLDKIVNDREDDNGEDDVSGITMTYKPNGHAHKVS